MSQQSFRELGVSPRIIDALAARSILEPFEIQASVLPDALAGLDILAKSPTGSGKTLAFAIPIAERTNSDDDGPRALVLAPTRELAQQVSDELVAVGRTKGLSVAAVYGGVPLAAQAKRARRAHVLVATPGRLMISSIGVWSSSAGFTSSSSTRPTACSTWASSRRSTGS